MPEALDLLLTRRSVKAINMVEPGPDRGQLETILTAAMRVPDHGKLAPWRFILIEGDARAVFGSHLARIAAGRDDSMDEGTLAAQAQLPMRAPTIVAVVSGLSNKKPIPEWEQRLSSGAVCQNMLMAAHAIGFVAQWITEWMAFDDDVARLLALEEEEKIAGFVYIGSMEAPPAERDRPDLNDKLTVFEG